MENDLPSSHKKLGEDSPLINRANRSAESATSFSASGANVDSVQQRKISGLSIQTRSSFEEDVIEDFSGHAPDGDIQDVYQRDALLKYKIFALICTLLISVGSHYSAHTLGALKSSIKKELGITNAQYGALQSTVSLVNTVLPIIGGLFIDSFGTEVGSIISTLFIMLGSIVVALSTNFVSFPMMVVGRLIYGLGSGTIVTVQETILGHWFRGSSLSAVIALQIATSRLSSFLSMGTSIPIANFFNFYGAAFWAASIVCVLSFLVNFFYVNTLRIIHKKLDSESLLRIKKKNKFTFALLFFFPGIFWLLTTESFILGSSWTSFLHINTEYVKLKFGVSDEVAAWNASFAQFLPVFLVPILGVAIDKYGYRVEYVILSSLFFCLSILVLGYTYVTPLLGMFIFSLSLASGPLAMVSSIALLVPSASLGTGLGLYKSALNVGSTIVDILVGFLQDHSHSGPPLASDYDNVMLFYIFWSVLALFAGIAISYLDKRHWRSLLQSDIIRRPLALQSNSEFFSRYSEDVIQNAKISRIKFKKWIPVLIFAVLLVISFIMFFSFLL